MDKTKVEKYNYTKCVFAGFCFMCHSRTKKVCNLATSGIFICSDECFKDYKKFVKEQLEN